LEWSLDQGLLPALLSRGYKSFPPELPYLVEPTSPVRQSGDEPLMLARRHPGAAVIVDSSRSRASRWVVGRFKPDLLILDDAFQHLALERDVDLVVLTAEDLFRDWNRVLPAGRWREGGQALSRASAFMLHITPEELSRHREAILDRLSGFAKPIFSFFLISHGVQRVIDGSWVSAVPGEYLLVSAVGSPQRVASTAEESLGRPPREHLIYPDHHFYSESDWFRIRDRSDRLGCSAVVCTSKDGVKLEPWADNRLSALEVDLDFGPSLNAPSDFPSWLAARLF
jgi:tetraacyldisaccharide 4'-kinase